MKIHFKHYTFLIVATFMLSFFLGCQKDDEQITKEVLQEIEIVKPENTSTSLLSGKDLDTHILYKEMVKDGGFVNHIYNPHDELFKIESVTPFTFTISQARKEEGKDYSALTFVLNRENKPIYDTDNLVLSEYNGTRKAYWYTYHFTEEIYRTYTNDQVFEIELPYTVRELSLAGQILKVKKGVSKLKREASENLNKASGCYWVAWAGPVNCRGAQCCNCHTPARAGHCDCINRGGSPPGYAVEWREICGSGGETGAQNGPLSMGYVTGYGEINIGRGQRVNINSGGGGGPFGDDGQINEPFLSPEEHAIMFFANFVQLNATQQNWLFQSRNRDYIPGLDQIINSNGFSQQSKDLAKAIVEFGRVNNNNEIAKDIIWGLLNSLADSKINNDQAFSILNLMKDHGYSNEVKTYTKRLLESAIENQLITVSPFVQYPKDKAEQYKRDYPALTNFLKNEIPKIASNQKIIQEIHDLTDTPINVIKEHLKWGKGPEILISQLGGEGINEKYGRYLGHVLPEEKNILRIDIDLVNDIGNLKNSVKFREEIGFLIAVTILHEYVHFGDTVHGNNFWSDQFFEDRLEENEAGILFEEAVFGETVWRTNVGIIFRNFGNF